MPTEGRRGGSKFQKTAPGMGDAGQTLRMPDLWAPESQDDVTTPGIPPELESSPDVAMPPGRIHGIEVRIVQDEPPDKSKRPFRALEVWTRNRLYAFNSQFTCFEVLDRASGKPQGNHPMLGARLGGGKWASGERSGVSYPLPLPGMEAMLVQGKKHGATSTVERVILRVRVVDTSEGPKPTWDEIANRWIDDTKGRRRRAAT